MAESNEMGGFVRIAGAWHSTQHGFVPQFLKGKPRGVTLQRSLHCLRAARQGSVLPASTKRRTFQPRGMSWVLQI